MPRVTDTYRDSRRRQIIDSARESFQERGFHATSMQDLFAASGLTAGAVYSYFKSKDDLIVAIAEDNMREVLARFGEVASHNKRENATDLLADALDVIRKQHQENQFAHVAVQVWAEALRNERVRSQLSALLATLATDLQSALRASGCVRADVEGLAGALLAIIPGYILQLTVRGDSAVKLVPDAIRTGIIVKLE